MRAVRLVTATAAAFATLAVFAIPGCGNEPPTTPTCTVTLAPVSRAFPAEGGSQTIDVTASAPTCSWEATPSASWVTVTSPATATGSGVVTYSVDVNRSAESRSATIRVGTGTHAISQAAAAPDACTYAVEPTALNVSSAASTGLVSMTTAAHCSWEASSTASWIALTSGTSGTGAATIRFSVEANRRNTPRSAAIIAAGLRVDITQAGEEPAPVCEYSVAPVELSPCMAAGTVATRITTAAGCPWTVTSDASWLTVTSGASGTGTTDIHAGYSSNYDAPRLGRLLVRWPSETAGQNVQVRQAGCRYGVSRTRIDVPADGGSAAFDVVQQSDPTECGGATQDRCVWSAMPDADWIEVTTAMPRAGDNPVSFTVRPNPSTQARTGSITVRDRVVVIAQAGQPH